MKYKIKKRNIFIVAISGFILGIFFANISELGICTNSFCDDFIEEAVGQTLGIFSITTLVISFALFFTREQVFNSWARFTKWYIPIVAVLILFASDGGGFFIGFGGGFDREGMIWFTSGLFLTISLLLIAIKSWRLRKQQPQI